MVGCDGPESELLQVSFPHASPHFQDDFGGILCNVLLVGLWPGERKLALAQSGVGAGQPADLK